MNTRLILPITFLSFSILAWWLVPNVLSGDLKPLLITGFAFVLFLVKKFESFWIGLILGFLTVGVSIPYPILEKLTPGIILIAIVTLFVFARDFWNKNILPNYLKQGIETKLMLLVCAIIILRFIYDRPFSATYGSRGGGAQAIYFFIGSISYFTMIKVAMQKWDIKKNLYILLFILIINTLQITVDRLIDYDYSQGVFFFLGGLFGGNLWFLCPLLLAIAMRRQESNPKIFNYFKNKYIIVIIVITLFFSIATPFRSRPYYGIMMILAVALSFRKKMNTLFMIGVVIITSIAFFTLMPNLHLPSLLERSLSTILPTSVSLQSHIGEAGFQSNFRLDLIETAWEDDIKMHPFLGKGFTYSNVDLILTESFHNIYESTMKSLALSGYYHNSVVQLAAVCGLPCAAAFVLAMLLSLKRLYQIISAKSHDRLFVLVTGVFAYFIVSIAQMLINGGAENFFGLCVLMGFIKGLSLNETLNSLDSTECSV